MRCKSSIWIGNVAKVICNGFKWVEQRSQFNEDSDIAFFIEGNVKFSEKLYDSHNDLPFLSKRMKLEKVEKVSG